MWDQGGLGALIAGDWLTTTQAAALWVGLTGERMSGPTMRRFCRQHFLERHGVAVMKVQRDYLISTDELLTYLDGRYGEAARRIAKAVEERHRTPG